MLVYYCPFYWHSSVGDTNVALIMTMQFTWKKSKKNIYIYIYIYIAYLYLHVSILVIKKVIQY